MCTNIAVKCEDNLICEKSRMGDQLTLPIDSETSNAIKSYSLARLIREAIWFVEREQQG